VDPLPFCNCDNGCLVVEDDCVDVVDVDPIGNDDLDEDANADGDTDVDVDVDEDGNDVYANSDVGNEYR
jgi:hypothetical protein